MSEHFATNLKSYLERTKTKAVDLERDANVPPSTVGKLITGVRPSVDRVTEILQAIPRHEAAKLLEAYLLDAVPQNWRDAVQIIILAAESALQSAPATVKDTLTRTLESINARARTDIDFAAWLTDTARLLNLIPDDDAAAEPAEATETPTPEPATLTRPPLTPAQYRATLPTGQPHPQQSLNEPNPKHPKRP